MPERSSFGTPGAPEPGAAIGGAGGAMDLATSEGEMLEGRQQDPYGGGGPSRGLWSDAWHDLRRRPIFIISALLILFLVVISIWPGLIATRDPLDCQLARSLGGPTPGHWFGFDTQGCDVYTRTVYGARASVTVGVCATIGVALLGSIFGGLAGFFGGVWDALLSRITDIFFGIPLILGALVFLAMITVEGVWPVVAVITVLAWPQIARIARGAVLSAKQNDYVQAARALGASNARILLRHILPNAVAPVIVVATIALGTYIALEATLSFLAVGLKPPTVSWGVDLSIAASGMQFRNAPHILLYPAGALSVTVLAFIMLGDAVRDALDPKLR